MNIKYAIGQEVWWATCRIEETSIECPHCGGTGRLRVTFHNETTVSIDCQNCAKGYEPPTGRVRVHNRTPRAIIATIMGIEIRGDGDIEYRISESYIIDEDRLFESRDAAMACAETLAADEDRTERERVQKKEKDTRSWAWNATYHRRQIAHAKKEITYHESKLAVASVKAKIDKRAKPVNGDV